ncbi:uncharacterized protein LOC143009696 [Genypterus blacodes]|uniref:uncharacterized protein LOC143009696 n=1 Tax=Genypterus blacodes TaxID=154954 RepID=UPI003F76E824
MSNRDSLGFGGDLLPQDVVDVFAQEKHTKRGRKKRSHSLGRALVWLKGHKRKDLGANGQRLGLGPALDLALDVYPAGQKGGHKAGKLAHPQGNSPAVQKRGNDDKAQVPPSFQENVFIEASRPKYLEDLHTEALEGLKMMQEEETNNGTDYQDNESTISNATVQAEGDASGFMSDSTIPDTSSVVSAASSVSTRSSRSGLTRQESTFRPLKSEKTRTRRKSRKTVQGIPHHVQRELGLDRVDWLMGPVMDEEQLFNGETDNNTEAQEGASGSPKNADTLQTVSEGEVKQFIAAHPGHKDDLALLHGLGPNLLSAQRPRSLAVPWMTTANSQQEPPSPVMSMSPQAAYMSKIIPNAVLPPSIDVVEISRGRSRNSVRTVSKSSLLVASPTSSRASSRASSSRASSSRASSSRTFSSRAYNMTSASRQNTPNVSDSSGWSNSDSSETLVSDSSTISSGSTPIQQGSQNGDYNSFAHEDKVSIHSSISKASRCTANGQVMGKSSEIKNEGAFSRSLSVIKSKKAPPPPNRSYSLHNKMKRRSRDLAEFRVPSGSSSPQSILARSKPEPIQETGSPPVSPGYSADTSSLDESSSSVPVSPINPPQREDNGKHTSPEKQQPHLDHKLKKTISPSSGYSSQDGTPPQLSKQSHSSSPKHKRGILAKLQSLFPGSAHAPTVSPPSPLTQPEAPGNTKSTKHFRPQPISLVDPANASPSVRALMELFNIPPPPKIHAPPPPPPEVWAHSQRSCELLLGPPAPNQVYTIMKKNPKDRRQQRQSPPVSREGSVKSLPAERKLKPVNGSIHVLETKKVQESEYLKAEVRKGNNERLAHTEQQIEVKGTSQVTEEDERIRVSQLLSGMLVKAVGKREERLAAKTQEDAKAHMQTSVTEVRTKLDTLHPPAISLVRISPSPSPPPSHHPPEPRTKAMSPTSEWPPPPPPMEPASETLDEVEFPPPPLFSEEGLVIALPPEKAAPVMNTESVTVTSHRIPAPPTSIPPPPAYSAPLPPVKQMSPAVTKKPSPSPFKVASPLSKAATPPPPKEISPPPSKEASPPKWVPPPISPPLVVELCPPPPKEVCPPAPCMVFAPPVKDISPPRVIEVSPPPTKAISPQPPKEVSPPPPKELSPPPPKELSPPPPCVVSPPPVKDISPLHVIEVSPPPTKETSPPPSTEISPPPPKEVSPPPIKDISPPVIINVVPSTPKEVSPPLTEDPSPPPPEEVSPPPAKEVSPPPPCLVLPPTVKDISPPLVKEVSAPSAEVVALPSPQEKACPPPEEATPTPILPPPQSIPTPPPHETVPPVQPQPPPSGHTIEISQESVPEEPPSWSGVLSPPQSIPPPPSELLSSPEVTPPKPDDATVQEASPSPPAEISIPTPPDSSLSPQNVLELAPSPPVSIPVPPTQPVEAPANIQPEPSPLSTEDQSQEQISPPVLQEDPTPVVTPSLLQTVPMSSPEPTTTAEDQAQAEVTMRTQQPSMQAPQKPIRRSLIITSPTSTSPPVSITSQPEVPKPQVTVVPPPSSSTTFSAKKSPPAVTISPSMNLQEAIRLRTAARSKDSPPSRLSLHSPPSPMGGDLHKSPSSTASFIFSKSYRKMGMATTPPPNARDNFQKTLAGEVSSVTKSVSEPESLKKGVKVPPPVARKPQTKAKDMGTELSAEEDAQLGSHSGSPEKLNGTAGTVEGGQTSS